MIRVNLLPIEEERRRSRARFQFIIFCVLLVLEIVALGGLYYVKSNQVARLEDKKTALQAEISKLQDQTEEVEKFRKKQERLQKKRDVLTDLESSRGGPVDLLRELQNILSQPANQMERAAQKRKGWNPNWDPSNVWIKKFVEEEGEFEMIGGALAQSDFANFLERLSSAEHFENVQMDRVGSTGKEAGTVEFRVTGKIDYAPKKDKKDGKKGNKKGDKGKSG